MVLVAALSFALTWLVRRYALRSQVVDLPNARSSHTVPTPRGAGAAVALSFLLGAGLCAAGPHAAGAILASAAFVAWLGFVDDHRHVPAQWRLLGQAIAAVAVLFSMGELPAIELFGWSVDFTGWGYVVPFLFLVWIVNLYNFMDGINGVAGVEAVSVCAGMCLIYWAVDDVRAAAWPALLLAATVGFLPWNFPRARIFLGDVGSGFLGLLLGALALDGLRHGSGVFWAWLILLGVFIVDATQTLARRLVRGERVYEAHRSHAYQHAAQRYGHTRVTVAVGLINLGWLMPLALVAARGWLDGALVFVVALLPLAALAWRFQAGEPAAGR